MSSKKYVELLVLYFTLDVFNRAILIFSDCRCWSHWSRCCSPTQVQGLLCVVRRTVQFGGGLTDCCRSHHLLHRSLWMHWSMEGEPLLCDDRKYICSTEKREGRGWKMSQPPDWTYLCNIHHCSMRGEEGNRSLPSKTYLYSASLQFPLVLWGWGKQARITSYNN